MKRATVGQLGLLGPQFHGPVTGRQLELIAQGYSPLEAEIEAEAERRRLRDRDDDTPSMFTQGEPKE